MPKKVLIVAPVHDVLLNTLESLGYQLDFKIKISQEEAEAIAFEYEGIITSTRLQMDRAFIDKAPSLKWVGRMGSGMEIIDVDYANAKNILCFSSPEGNANAVAEQALGMLLSLQHKINSAFAEMQHGIWLRDENRGIELEGLTAGIIGYGHNGSAFAKKLCAMDVQVLALDKYKSGFATTSIKECQSIDEIYEAADIISFHLPLNDETRYYFNQDFLERMQKPFTLLNLSRGKVASQQTVYDGLKSGKILGAALDVWEIEPVNKMQDAMKAQMKEMLSMPNFIGTPHIAGYTVQALYKMSYYLAEKIKAALS